MILCDAVVYNDLDGSDAWHARNLVRALMPDLKLFPLNRRRRAAHCDSTD